MIKNYIFLGAPGVGKGTMAEILADKKDLVHISTGKIFRDEIEQETTLGKQVKEILFNGGYVSNEITNSIVKNTIIKPEIASKGFILDGYPRTINQAKFLKSEGINITNVVLLDAPEKLIINRLMERKRSDDNQEVIEQRLEIYKSKTSPLIDWYKKEGILKVVDVSSSIDENYNELESELF